MSLIGILIAVVFIILLAKAICETIWGTLCLIWGIILHTIAYALEALAWILEAMAKAKRFAGK